MATRDRVPFTPQVIVSTSEAERLAKLGAYFRTFLQDWVAGIAAGVTHTPAISRELARVFCEAAAMSILAMDPQSKRESDDETADRCMAGAQAAFEAIAKFEVTS